VSAERAAPTAGAATTTTPAASKAGGKPHGARAKGPRPKHVPQRTCVACRGHDAKRGLHRIVRTPEGPVELDPTGKRNGRGAYLCGRPGCWDKALATNLLGRSLRTDLSPHAVAALRAFAATLPDPAPAAADADPAPRGAAAGPRKD
jgi:uncharacterized protein